MSKKRIAIYFFAGFLTFLIILLLLAPIFVDLNRFKPQILEQVKKATGREANLSSISLSIIPWLGARLNGIELSNSEGFSKTPQIKIDSVRVKIRFFPLLFKKIKIKEINLVAPEILIEKKGVQYNFSDLTKKPEEVPSEKKAEKKSEGAPSPLLKEFSLDEFKLTNGKITYTELDEKGSVINKLILSQFNIKIEDLSNSKKAKFNLSTNLNESKEESITLTGNLGPGWADDFKKANFDISLLITKLNLKQFASLAKNQSLQGVLYVNLFVKGNLDEQIETGGEISLSEFIKELNDKLIINEEMSINFKSESVQIKGIKIGTSIPIIQITGGVFNFKKDPSLDITLSSPPIQLKKISEYEVIKKSLPGNSSLEGIAKIDGKVSGTKDKLALKASLDMSGAEIKYGDLFKKPAGKTLNLAAEIVSEGKLLRIKSIILALLDAQFTISGLYNTGTQDADIHLSTNDISLKSLSPVIPPSAIKNPVGTLQLNADMKGSLKEKGKLNINGAFTLKNIGGEVTGIAKPLENIGGKILFTRNSLDVQSLKANAGETSLKIDMNIRDFDKPKVNFLVNIPRLNLDEIMPPSPSVKKEEAKKEEKPQDRESLKKYTVKGKLTIDSAIVRKIEFKNLEADLSFENNKLQLSNFSLQTFNGTVNGGTTIDISSKEPSLVSELHLKNIDVNAVLSTLSTYKDTIYGNLFSDLNISASGDNAERIKSTMTGGGLLTLTDGKINTFSAISQLVNISNLPADKFKKSTETRFKEIKTSAKIEKGRVYTKEMVLTSDEFNARMDGSFGLDSTLDYKGEATLSKETSDKIISSSQGGKYGLSEIGGVLKDENGRIVIPFILGGTIKSPKFSLDTAQAKEKAKKMIQKKVQEEINKEIKKNIESEKAKELEKKGKEKLKGLFKK